MRIDHIAYQRATRVAVFGLTLQAAIGLLLLVFGIVAGDTTILFASGYALVGVPVWLCLVILFHQHRLERLEALESDELQAQRLAGHGSAFETEVTEFRVASRRLEQMYKWMSPIFSWAIIVALTVVAGRWLWLMSIHQSPGYEGNFDFTIADARFRGWTLAICLGVAAVSFIFSRFVAGMARQPAWQNLRGGAGYMVGNAVVMLATAAGFIFTYFENTVVLSWIARGVLYFMLVFAAETILNFLLNLYRPRRVGEVPRPAFDSRLLSLLSAPDSIVRSINEAINYQFGFDITSSWGYQLLLRVAWKLVALAVLVLVVLNSLVIVEPHQQAVRTRGGEIVGDESYGPGLMVKWPWPFESAEVYDVTRIRALQLTPPLREPAAFRVEPVLWTTQIDPNLGIEPFIVSTSSHRSERPAASGAAQTPVEPPTAIETTEPDEPTQAEEAAEQVVREGFALIEADFVLHYRIRPDGGLLKFLNFSSEAVARRQPLQMRERALKAIALREITQYLAQQDLDRIVSEDRARMSEDLRRRVQAAFDRPDVDAGVEVVAVLNPWIRPAGDAAKTFEVLSYNLVGSEKKRAEASRQAASIYTTRVGGEDNLRRLEAMIAEIEGMRQLNAPAEQVAAREAALADAMIASGGEVSRVVLQARSDLWVKALLDDARVQRFRGRLAPYSANPRIYREFLTMDTLKYVLQSPRKYILGIDPSKFNIDVSILQEDAAMSFLESISQDRKDAAKQ